MNLHNCDFETNKTIDSSTVASDGHRAIIVAFSSARQPVFSQPSRIARALERSIVYSDLASGSLEGSPLVDAPFWKWVLLGGSWLFAAIAVLFLAA